jgi:uncharacterized protein (TIGR03000 family)
MSPLRPVGARAQPAPKESQPASDPADVAPRNAARIAVLLSPGAELTVEGVAVHQGKQQGARRLFRTPALAEGQPYYYVIGASWLGDDGRRVSRERTVAVEPGKSYQVDLRTGR